MGSRWQSRGTAAVVEVTTVPLMSGHVIVRVVEHLRPEFVGRPRRVTPGTLLGGYVRVDEVRGDKRRGRGRLRMPAAALEAATRG